MIKEYYEKQLATYPNFRKATILCKDMKAEVLTETGIKMRSTSGGGLRLHFESRSGRKYTALVFREEQYLEELYKLDKIAVIENPLPIKKEETKSKCFIETDKRMF